MRQMRPGFANPSLAPATSLTPRTADKVRRMGQPRERARIALRTPGSPTVRAGWATLAHRASLGHRRSHNPRPMENAPVSEMAFSSRRVFDAGSCGGHRLRRRPGVKRHTAADALRPIALPIRHLLAPNFEADARCSAPTELPRAELVTGAPPNWGAPVGLRAVKPTSLRRTRGFMAPAKAGASLTSYAPV